MKSATHYAQSKPKSWFACLYETLLGAPQGPRMGSFIALYGRKETIALIRKVLAGDANIKCQISNANGICSKTLALRIMQFLPRFPPSLTAIPTASCLTSGVACMTARICIPARMNA